MIDYAILQEIQKIYQSLSKKGDRPQKEDIDKFISILHKNLPDDKRIVVASFYWNDEKLKEIFGDKTIILNKHLKDLKDVELLDIEKRFEKESEIFKNKYSKFVSLVNVFQKAYFSSMWIKPQTASGTASFSNCVEKFFELLGPDDELKRKINGYTNGFEGFKDDLMKILINVYNVKNEEEEKINIFYYPSFIGDRIFFDGLFVFEFSQFKLEDLISLERMLAIFIRDLHLSVRLYFSRLESIKTAISAIMSRNMSHNIGSHVLADLVAAQDHKSMEGLNHFFRYLQNRMDFIAQITTDFPEWTYAVHFNNELMRIFYENYILIDRIGVSEGLSAYKWNKDWRKEEMRGKIIVRTCIAQQENSREKNFDWVINEYHMEELNSDLQLAIPGGIVGYHAFYVIIEDIIRNSAKHDYATRLRKSDFDEGHNNTDNIIFIRYKNSGECSYWAVNENTADEEMKSSDAKSIDIKKCKTFVIESSCFKVDKKEEPKKRDFIKNDEFTLIDGQKIKSSEGIKVYITCVKNSNNCNFSTEIKNDCQNCLVVDKNYWSEQRNYFQVLTNAEYNQFLGKTEISKEKGNKELAMKKRDDGLIDFLESGPLRINIRIDDMVDEDYVWVTIWDNMRHFASTNFDGNDGNIEIDMDQNQEVCGDIDEDEMKERVLEEPKNQDGDERNFKIINLFDFMNDKLCQSFIKQTGELRKEDWGIAELKICAGFLQNRKTEEIGVSGRDIIQFGKKANDLIPDSGDIINEKDNPNNGYPKMIIKALPVDKAGKYIPGKDKNKNELEEGQPYYLGYRFWMKKPKTAALVGIECRNGREKKDGN